MMEITIRRATEADCGLIHGLAWRIFPDTYREILTQEQSDYMMEWMYSMDSLRQQMTEEHVFLLAFCDGEAIGYVSVERESERLWHLQKLYVLPDRQKTHCGRRLFEAAKELIRQEGVLPCTMELNVNRHNPALGFYEHMGMTRRREGDFPIGNGFFMNDFIMGIEIEG